MDEFKSRFAAAKKQRSGYVEDASREAYKLCFNGRETEWDRVVRHDNEPEEIFTDFCATVAEEFAGELFSTMTPENQTWVEYETGVDADDPEADAIEEDLSLYEQAITKAIRSSNYYDEGPTAFQDAAIGTVCMWVERMTLAAPFTCEAIPLSQVYLRLGRLGVEDRFRVQKYAYQDLPALLPGATFPRDMQDKIEKSKGLAEVVWGFWRDYSDPMAPVWEQAIRVDGKEVGLDDTLGPDGSCPMIVGRFNPISNSPFGRGPALRMLPTLRMLDELASMNIEGMDRALDPAFIYNHDGMVDFSNGIEAGMGYPAMPGTAESFRPIGVEANLDYGYFSEERIMESVRYGFYREMEQRGKTPPSASQYLGEEQKQVRRMARPAVKLWREFGVGFLKRVEWLERQPGGSMVGVEFPMLDSGAIIARPVSPLERAQARDDVLVAQSIMGMANEALGPEQAALVIDGPNTMVSVKAALKDRIVTFRTQEEIAQIIQAQQPQQPEGAPVEGPV